MTDTELLTQISQSTTAACTEMQNAHADLLEAMGRLATVDAGIATAKADASAAKAEASSAKIESGSAKALAEAAGTKADANAVAIAAVKSTADAAKAAIEDEGSGLAATKQTADDAALLAEGALQKSGGTMKGAVSNLKLAGLEALSYDASAVSSQWTQENYCRNFPLGEGKLYVDPPNGSDTDGLFVGLGLSPELPFASLQGAWDWMRKYHYNNGYTQIFLMNDCECNGFMFSSATMNCVQLRRYDTTAKPKLTLHATLSQYSGFIDIEALKLEFPDNGTGSAINIAGNFRGGSPTMRINNCELTGSVATVFEVEYNASLYINGCTGSISGKKYSCTYGSRIMTYNGESNIPGTTAGTKDAGSVVL